MTAVCGDILDEVGAYILDEAGAFIWDELGPCNHLARDGGGSRRRHVDQRFVEQAWAQLEAELAQIKAEKNPKRIAKPRLAKLAKIHRRAIKLDVPVGAALLRQHIEKVEQTYQSVLQDSLQAAKATEDYRLAALIALQARQEDEDEEDIMLLLAA